MWGLTLLDQSNAPFDERLFAAMWNAVNLTTNLVDFSDFDERQRLFIIAAMSVTMLVRGDQQNRAGR
ncbi:hypothetical protein [Paraburkholderia sp. Cpub6]|uniref:hypothetical protein n=1 Tax=Paraburkholderia sp. Cpub6 TaxID=2723094 RepID=UPI0016130F22|nr:hypothetical protein [Paraburkholderia sp. Cpub6]MBB5460291.1 hypothetical protein [Paraburkholderia sp. Cpub6]